jgi:hypothetical protein
MSGGRHRAAMESLRMIFEEYIKPEDSVGFIHFNHNVTVDIELIQKKDGYQRFIQLFNSLTTPCVTLHTIIVFF